jgi:4'-phosphopantetheinyl transferase
MTPCLSPCRDRVDLWLAQGSQLRQAGLIDRCRELLSPDEAQRESRLRFQEDRDSFVLTRALVRCALSRYDPRPATSWRFRADAKGRPHLVDAQDFEPALDISISHTRELSAVAVAFGRRVGVDVERADRLVNSNVRRANLDAAERSAFSDWPEAVQRERFMHTWTLKESYLKALGCGLSRPTTSFGFVMAGDTGLCLQDPDVPPDQADRWRFTLLDLPPDHIGAVCIEDGRCVDVALRQMVPLLGEAAMPLLVRRRSAHADVHA